MKLKVTTVIRIIGLIFIIGVIIYLLIIEKSFELKTFVSETAENQIILSPAVQFFETDAGDSFEFDIEIAGIKNPEDFELLIDSFNLNKNDCSNMTPSLFVDPENPVVDWLEGSNYSLDEMVTIIHVKVNITEDVDPGDYWIAIGLEETGFSFIRTQVFGTYYFRVGGVETESCINTWVGQ